MMGVDLNAAADSPTPIDIQIRGEPSTPNHKLALEYATNYMYVKNKTNTPLNSVHHVTVLTTVFNRVCLLADKLVGAYLEAHPDRFRSEPLDINSIQIDNLRHDELDKFKSIVAQRSDVFAAKTNTLPSAMTDVKPHDFVKKHGAKPIRVSKPKFGRHTSTFLLKWRNWAKKSGLISRSPLAQYSSRLHIAAKYKSDSSKSGIPDDLRVCWAGILINEMLKKTISTYPCPISAVYKAAWGKYKFSADGLKQYWSIPLTDEAAKMTAFYLPDDAGGVELWHFNRLVMGTKNAATVAQNAYRKAMRDYLTPEQQKKISNFADDFIGHADSIEELLELFEAFLIMCQKAGITLNPKKVRFGFTTEKFYGYKITGRRIQPSDRNLSPVHNMVPPTNVSELRSVMGVFNQFAPFIKDYAKSGQPASILNELLKKNLPFVFSERHKDALQKLRDQCLSSTLSLHSPLNDHPLILETDGSDDGWGGILYQMENGARKAIRMWSKTWPKSYLNKPPYHCEAKAWMNCMELAKPFALDNHHPIECYTDHSPLTWIKYTSGKGPVSQFVLENLSEMDFKMNYLKGEENEVADALSRFPLLGPRRLRTEGHARALNVLLAAITESNVNIDKIWFNAGKDTQFLLPSVLDWRDDVTRNSTIKYRALKVSTQAVSSHQIEKSKYSLAILMPVADKCTILCKQMLGRGLPFAFLMPSDLVHRVSINRDRTMDPDIQEMVDKAHKIALLTPELTWVIANIDSITGKRVLAIESMLAIDSASNETISDLQQLQQLAESEGGLLPGKISSTHDIASWTDLPASELDKYPQDQVTTDSKGLHYYIRDATSAPKVIVPPDKRESFITWAHKVYFHAGGAKVYNRLNSNYYWKGMRKQCLKVCASCALCNLLKAKRNMAHRHFRAKLHSTPRTSYAMDYYGVKSNQDKFNNILGIIDLATGYLVLQPVVGRSALNTANVLLYSIVCNRGVPLTVHSDAAREFLGGATLALSQILGIQQTTTLGYNPRANSKMERVWAYVGQCLRAMSDAQYSKFHLYVPIMAYVYNTLVDSDTNVSPFELEFGMPVRTAPDSLLPNPSLLGMAVDEAGIVAIKASTQAFRTHLKQVKSREKAEIAAKLNSSGKPKVAYKIGQHVSIYLPPSQEQAQKHSRKVKHFGQFVGPAVITEALSDNGTAYRVLYKNKTFDRHITNLHGWKGPVPPILVHTNDGKIRTGNIVAVLDKASDTHYHLARVLIHSETITKVHYAATAGSQLRHAVWQLLYRKKVNNRFIYQYENDRSFDFDENRSYIGVFNSDELKDFIILNDVRTEPTPRGFSVHPSFVTKLRRDNFPYKNHVMGVTWRPEER